MSKQTFNQTGDFEAYHAAEAWLKENGYSAGSMCGDQPIGILKGDVYIPKWRNLTNSDKRILHGRLTGDMRIGPVTLEIY